MGVCCDMACDHRTHTVLPYICLPLCEIWSYQWIFHEIWNKQFWFPCLTGISAMFYTFCLLDAGKYLGNWNCYWTVVESCKMHMHHETKRLSGKQTENAGSQLNDELVHSTTREILHLLQNPTQWIWSFSEKTHGLQMCRAVSSGLLSYSMCIRMQYCVHVTVKFFECHRLCLS